MNQTMSSSIWIVEYEEIWPGVWTFEKACRQDTSCQQKTRRCRDDPFQGQHLHRRVKYRPICDCLDCAMTCQLCHSSCSTAEKLSQSNLCMRYTKFPVLHKVYKRRIVNARALPTWKISFSPPFLGADLEATDEKRLWRAHGRSWYEEWN